MQCHNTTVRRESIHLYLFILDCLYQFTGQHSHLSGGLHPAHTHMHGGWSGWPGALGASSSLQSGFATAGSLGGSVVPHSQSYHLGLNSMVINLIDVTMFIFYL
jgi:hypothetical protein